MLCPRPSKWKIFFCAAVIFFTGAGPGWAFLFDLPVRTQQEISRLTDKELADAHIAVAVEMEAVKVFYSNSGFTPKEYDKMRDLIRYRILLIQEFEKRSLPVPRTQ